MDNSLEETRQKVIAMEARLERVISHVAKLAKGPYQKQLERAAQYRDELEKQLNGMRERYLRKNRNLHNDWLYVVEKDEHLAKDSQVIRKFLNRKPYKSDSGLVSTLSLKLYSRNVPLAKWTEDSDEWWLHINGLVRQHSFILTRCHSILLDRYVLSMSDRLLLVWHEGPNAASDTLVGKCHWRDTRPGEAHAK
jgi:hypothetical protein